MASFLRRRKARFGQSCVAECPTGDISTEDWEDYVLVTVDQKPNATHYLEQPANRHRARSLESSLDSGYEEIHVPPPLAEEDTAVGSGSICSDEAKQESEEDRPACRTDRDLGQHHSFFGQRFYKYDDTDCEGNRYITNEEL